MLRDTVAAHVADHPADFTGASSGGCEWVGGWRALGAWAGGGLGQGGCRVVGGCGSGARGTAASGRLRAPCPRPPRRCPAPQPCLPTDPNPLPHAPRPPCHPCLPALTPAVVVKALGDPMKLSLNVWVEYCHNGVDGGRVSRARCVARGAAPHAPAGQGWGWAEAGLDSQGAVLAGLPRPAAGIRARQHGARCHAAHSPRHPYTHPPTRRLPCPRLLPSPAPKQVWPLPCGGVRAHRRARAVHAASLCGGGAPPGLGARACRAGGAERPGGGHGARAAGRAAADAAAARVAPRPGGPALTRGPTQPFALRPTDSQTLQPLHPSRSLFHSREPACCRSHPRRIEPFHPPSAKPASFSGPSVCC